MTLTMPSGTSKASNGRRMNRSRRASATMPKLKASLPHGNIAISIKNKLRPVLSAKKAGGFHIQQKSVPAASANAAETSAQTGKRRGGLVFTAAVWQQTTPGVNG